MRFQTLAALLLSALAPPGRAAPAPAAPRALSVAVAANMMPAMEDIRRGFLDETGADLLLTPGSSGKLVTQIENGAPFDVFLSADMEFPERLHRDGFAAAAPDLYASGTLILWSLGSVDLSHGLASLKDAAVVKVALADPRAAPYGRQAEAALKAAGLLGPLSGKLVYGESIGQVNQFVATRAADVGFTARSTVEAAKWKGKGTWREVDRSLYSPIAQGLVVLPHAARVDAKLAGRLRAYVLGPKGRAVLKRYGYVLP